jgi:hypothetical protein
VAKLFSFFLFQLEAGLCSKYAKNKTDGPGVLPAERKSPTTTTIAIHASHGHVLFLISPPIEPLYLSSLISFFRNTVHSQVYLPLPFVLVCGHGDACCGFSNFKVWRRTARWEVDSSRRRWFDVTASLASDAVRSGWRNDICYNFSLGCCCKVLVMFL